VQYFALHSSAWTKAQYTKEKEIHLKNQEHNGTNHITVVNTSDLDSDKREISDTPKA
jgi:hypothetical protein